MLDLFRRHAGSWGIKVVFGIIIVVFVLWGGYSYKSRQETEMARVGDKYISVADYNNAYNQLIEQYRRQFGGSLPEELLKQLNLKKQTLDMLIDRVIISKAAEEMGLVATNEEVRQMILQVPGFQRDGSFDHQLYTMLLQQNRMTPESFEQQMANDLTVQKVADFIRRRAVVTEDDILAEFRFNNEKIQAAYVLFDPKSFEAQVAVDEKSLRDYYQGHQENYRDPEKRQFAYVVFKADDYLNDVKVTDEEVRQYYDENQATYHHEQEVHARHILFSVKEDAPEAEVAKTKAEAEKVLEQVKKGGDFAELAKQYSQDPGSSKSGGDLGYFSREKMVEPFSDAAFSMKPGEVSDLVRTPFGFHIIKVEDVRPERTVPLEEVKGEIETTLKKDRARDTAYRKARDFADAAYAQRDVEKAAQTAKLPVTSTDAWLSQNDTLAGIPGSSASIMGSLFSLPDRGVSDIIDIPEGYVVAQVKAVQAPQVLAFEAVKARVEREYKDDQARVLAQQKASEILDAARKSGSLEAAAKEKQLDVKKTDWFSRREPDKQLKLRGESLNSVFQLQEAHPFPESPLTEVGNRFVALQMLGRQSSDEGLEKERESIAKRLLAQKQGAMWVSWLDQQRSKVKIERFKEL